MKQQEVKHLDFNRYWEDYKNEPTRIFRIGRDQGINDKSIPDNEVSREHCIIIHTKDDYFIVKDGNEKIGSNGITSVKRKGLKGDFTYPITNGSISVITKDDSVVINAKYVLNIHELFADRFRFVTNGEEVTLREFPKDIFYTIRIGRTPSSWANNMPENLINALNGNTSVSAHHCSIKCFFNGNFEITDGDGNKASTNGTWVNGIKLKDKGKMKVNSLAIIEFPKEVKIDLRKLFGLPIEFPDKYDTVHDYTFEWNKVKKNFYQGEQIQTEQKKMDKFITTICVALFLIGVIIMISNKDFSAVNIISSISPLLFVFTLKTSLVQSFFPNSQKHNEYFKKYNCPKCRDSFNREEDTPEVIESNFNGIGNRPGCPNNLCKAYFI